MQHVLCLSNYPYELIEGWVQELDCHITVADRSKNLADLDLASADVVIGDASRHFRLDAAALAAMPRCRVILQPSVGVDGVIDLDNALAKGIAVANAPGYNSAAVADWTIMAMLVGLRHGVEAANNLRAEGWSAPDLGTELGEVTVGLIGYGAVGRAVHERLRGFGSTVLATTRRSRHQHADSPHWVALNELFECSDIVSLHLPHSPQTHHLVDADRLSRMRPGSMLINSARGALIDEQALVAALRSGCPSAAALDVFTTEPLPATSSLLQLPQVYLTPHIAASTQQARTRVRTLIGVNLRRALLGEELQHQLS